MLGNVSEASEGNVGSNIPEPESRDLARLEPDQFKYHHINIINSVTKLSISTLQNIAVICEKC